MHRSILFVLPLASVLLLTSNRVYSGTRKDVELACPKPVASTESLSEDQAAVKAEATVRGMVSAAAGGDGAKVRAYETVMLSTEAYERAWMRYELCTQHAAGKIDATTYERWREPIMGPMAPAQSGSSPTSTTPPSTPGSSNEISPSCEPSSIAGVWKVASINLGQGTCSSDEPPGTITSYIWIVSVDAQCWVDISVQGKTAFPSLSGKLDGKVLTLQGLGDPGGPLIPASWFGLTLDGGELHGTRRYQGFKQILDYHTDEPNGMVSSCFVDFDVTATR